MPRLTLAFDLRLPLTFVGSQQSILNYLELLIHLAEIMRAESFMLLHKAMRRQNIRRSRRETPCQTELARFFLYHCPK